METTLKNPLDISKKVKNNNDEVVKVPVSREETIKALIRGFKFTVSLLEKTLKGKEV